MGSARRIVWSPPVSPRADDEGFASGWNEQWSWGTRVASVSAPTASGTQALKLTYTYGWAGFRMTNAGDNWTSYRALRFALRGGSSQNIPVRVWVKTASGATIPLGVVTAPASRWVTVELPLPADPALNAVSELVVQEDRGRTPRQALFLDWITLEGVAPSATLYDEGFTPRWQELWSWGATATPVGTPTASGAEALQVIYAYGWGGFRMQSALDDWRGYRTLRFAIHGGAAGGQAVRVWVKTASGATFDLGVVTAPAGRYATAELALPTDPALRAVTELVVQEHTGQTPVEPIILDRIELAR